jgi:hypothetical protein
MFPLCSSSTNSISRLLTATIFSYFGLVKDPEDPDRTVDPDSVWLDLCLHDDLAKLAKARCVAFLRAYVKDSEQEFPILVPLEETGEEPQETEWRRTATSAHSLLNIWRSLIAEADATVLLKKRREDPAKKNIWRLKFMDNTNRLGQGPVMRFQRSAKHPSPLPLPISLPLRDDMSGTPSFVLPRLTLISRYLFACEPPFCPCHSRPLLLTILPLIVDF